MDNRSPLLSQPQSPEWMNDFRARIGEEHDLKKRSNGIGLALLAVYLLMNLLPLFFIGIADSCGFNLPSSIGVGFGGMHPALYYLVTGNAYLWSTVLPFALYLRLSKTPAAEVMPFRRAGFGRCAALVAAGLAVCVCANYAANLLTQNLALIGVYPYLPDSPYSGDLLSLLLFVATSALIPAFVEEFIFRGVIMGSLRRFGKGFAVFASALIFGLFHGNLVQIPFAFLVGLALGFVAIQTQSLWPAVWVHFLNNFYSCAMTIVARNAPEELYTLVFLCVTLCMLLAGFIGFACLACKDKQLFSLSGEGSALSFRVKTGYLFATPGMILVMVFILLQTLLLVQVRL